MEEKLINVGTFADSITAHIAKGKLESEGIICFLKNDSIIANTGFNVMYGGIELMVKNSDAEKAQAILDHIENPES